MTTLIGLVVGVETGELYGTMFPDFDRQLDEPRWVNNFFRNTKEEPMKMLKVRREQYESLDPLELQALIQALR